MRHARDQRFADPSRSRPRRLDGASTAVFHTLAFLFLVLSFTVGCTEPPKAELRGDCFDRVRAVIAQRMEKHGIASISIAAAQDGEVVWEESFGWADKEKQIPATPHSMYALASITKSLTATGLMVLVERGLVDLDRPANDYLPGTKLMAFAGEADQATVRRVLQHTAGLPMHVNIFPIVPGAPRPPDQDESIRRYGIIVQEPGREYHYSNFGYGIIDRIIAGVSGESYAEFMKTEVFVPLGMTHTSVMIDSSLEQFAVQNYDGRGHPAPRLDFDHRGASSVYASVHDLIRFGMFHLKNGLPDQTRIVSGEAIDLTHEPSDLPVGEKSLGEVHPGLGWAVVDLSGHRFVIASGGMPGTVTRLALIPLENVAVAIAANGGTSEFYSPWDIEWEAFAALLRGFPELPEIPKAKPDSPPFPPELVGEWAGTVTTHEGVLPARLSIGSGTAISLDLDGRTIGPIPVENPLGSIGFNDGLLKGPFLGGIATEDAGRSPHVLFLRLRLRDDLLFGYIAAVAMDRTFILPSWMELRRATE